MDELRIIEEIPTPKSLGAYAGISIAFTTTSRLRALPVNGGLAGLSLIEEPLAQPLFKDYDRMEAENPRNWPRHWDLAGWMLLLAWQGDVLAGGTAVAWRSNEFRFLGDRTDAAVVADIRVAPEYRRQGIGSALFQSAEAWARERGCRWLAVETQDTNPAACRFYAAMGCTLGSIERFAYVELPDEARLIWYLELQ